MGFEYNSHQPGNIDAALAAVASIRHRFQIPIEIYYFTPEELELIGVNASDILDCVDCHDPDGKKLWEIFIFNGSASKAVTQPICRLLQQEALPIWFNFKQFAAEQSLVDRRLTMNEIIIHAFIFRARLIRLGIDWHPYSIAIIARSLIALRKEDFERGPPGTESPPYSSTYP